MFSCSETKILVKLRWFVQTYKARRKACGQAKVVIDGDRCGIKFEGYPGIPPRLDWFGNPLKRWNDKVLFHRGDWKEQDTNGYQQKFIKSLTEFGLDVIVSRGTIGVQERGGPMPQGDIVFEHT